MNVGRIVASVTIENAVDLSKALTCDALVDTGASLGCRMISHRLVYLKHFDLKCLGELTRDPAQAPCDNLEYL